MKLASGKRIGQSGLELVLAAGFSFLIHVILLSGAVFLYVQTTVRAIVPPFYQVSLVAPTPDMPLTAGQAPVPAPPVQKPKAKKLKLKEKKASLKKGAMPELARPKPKSAKEESEEAADKPAQPSTTAGIPGATGKAESVAVTTPQDFKFPPYLAIVRERVVQNWNPPPGAKGTKAKVLFKVLRSGRVGESKLEESSGNFYFDQAAMRAILSSSPFPPLPDDFSQDFALFSVDLMENE